MSVSIEDALNWPEFGGGNRRPRSVTFLPEPKPRPRKFTLVSVDDHLVEPPHVFEGRVPAALAESAPHVVEGDDGAHYWVYDGKIFPNVGFNAVVGRPRSEYGSEPTRFDEMRRGAWDIRERVRDMDINGVWASLCFPSFLPGFAGQRLTLGPADEKLAWATFLAWNDWHLEEWAGTNPGRMIPCQLPWLRDPEVAAEEIRRNADRGFTAVTFSEAPDKLGLPSIHTGHWDPFLEACAETETVVCLHVGSSGTMPATSPDAPAETVAVLFFAHAMYAAVDWLYSLVAVRFPGIKIVLSEGGISWVAGLMDRLDHQMTHAEGSLQTWSGIEPSPTEVLQRNFWFCALDDETAFLTRDRIGVDNILIESDYPHADSTWPDTQLVMERQLRGCSESEIRRITWENAANLFRLSVPDEALTQA